MPILKIKYNVNPFGVKPEIALSRSVVMSIFFDRGYDCIITSITDGKHSHESEHYKGYAEDYRTRHLEGGAQGDLAKEIASEIQGSLTDEYKVVLEKTHLHVSFDPSYSDKKNNA